MMVSNHLRELNAFIIIVETPQDGTRQFSEMLVTIYQNISPLASHARMPEESPYTPPR
jgi:hypothetical protein